MAGFGEVLRIARVEKGLEVEDVALMLSLRKRVIEALENEQISELPERPLALGYTERYARLLGLDPLSVKLLYPPRDPTVEWRPQRRFGLGRWWRAIGVFGVRTYGWARAVLTTPIHLVLSRKVSE